MERDFFLPTLPYWTYGNNWSGSCGKLRFFVTAGRETMLAEVWDEDVCRDLAQVRASASFDVSQPGLDTMRDWLAEQIALLG